MPHPGRNNIYEAVIRRMVQESLDAQEQVFIRNRCTDSDEQLLDYLRFCAGLLEHTPWPAEITGGSLIETRFGSWENALAAANLPKPVTPDKRTTFARYQEEVQRQKLVYREKKAAKKRQAQQPSPKQKENKSV